MFNNFQDKIVLITGGVRGIGLSTGLAFAKHGAKCVLTYKWDRGPEELDQIKEEFLFRGYKEPLLVQADVVQEEDVERLMEQMRAYGDTVAVFVSNVAFAPLIRSFEDYTERSLLKSIDYSAWPLISFTKAIKRVLGQYPRYVVGLSSNGPDAYHVNYDFVAASKALLETLVRYLNYRFKEENVMMNIIRARCIRTASLQATCGEEFVPFGEQYNAADIFLEPHEVSDAILALCSGMMDGIRGQVLNVDRGSTFADNIMLYYENRHELGM